MESSDDDGDQIAGHAYAQNRWHLDNRNRQHQNVLRPRNNAGNFANVLKYHNSVFPWDKDNNGVTTLYRCNASDAKCLYIFDSAYKLQKNNQYDIGGAYAPNDTGLWFYFTTTPAPGRNYLMNVFVCQRKPGMFSIGISDSNTLSTTAYYKKNKEKFRSLNNELFWQKFQTNQPDEVSYIKTFCFSEEDRVSLLETTLLIPISIDMNPKTILITDVVQSIKAELDFGEKLFKDEVPDFIIKSQEGTDFKVHKIVLAAHSPKLRDLVRDNNCKTLCLKISDKEVELLLQYLYTGVIKDILNQPLEELLMLADEFQLNNLRELVKHAMKLSITTENALAIAIMAEKHNYNDIQEDVFLYVLQHPEVIDSDAFVKIDNANVVKKLLKYIHANTSEK